jgi:predicted Zn-dependent protease
MRPKSILHKLALSLLVFAVSFCAGCAINPITGQEELMFFPESHDVEIGTKYAPEIEKQLGGRIQNETLQNYIDSVGQKVARVSHKPYFEYHFVALEDDTVNAFALPGGHIFITKGMLQKLDSEAQLAAILAHETTHVVARDTMNMMSKQIGIDILFAAAATAADNVPRGAWDAANIARQIISLKYSRTDERQADLGGLEYMFRAGYNPYGMVETMEMLERQERFAPTEFLSSHPSPENRVTYIARRIQSRYYNQAGLIIGKEAYRTAVLEQLTEADSSG